MGCKRLQFICSYVALISSLGCQDTIQPIDVHTACRSTRTRSCFRVMERTEVSSRLITGLGESCAYSDLSVKQRRSTFAHMCDTCEWQSCTLYSHVVLGCILKQCRSMFAVKAHICDTSEWQSCTCIHMWC